MRHLLTKTIVILIIEEHGDDLETKRDTKDLKGQYLLTKLVVEQSNSL